MNTRDYRSAMDQLNPAPELEGRIKGRLNLPPRRQAHPRRLAGKVLVAAAAIACTFMVAMAVSPQLRAAVLTFFHLEETEQVPGPVGEAPEEPELTQTTIDHVVEAQYIRLSNAGAGYSYGAGTLFQAERADDGSLLDLRYWAAEGDQLVPLETRTTGFSTTWEGVTYTDTVYWCVYEGAISCYCSGTAGYALDYDCNAIAIPGSTDSVILRLSQGSQMDYRQYPVLLDLETGEVTDLLDGTGWEQAAPLTDVRWTDDLSAALLSSDRTGWFYCDRVAKTTASLGELTGLEVFSAWFGQDGALILLTRSGPDGECYDVWTWQPDSGALKRTFSQLPAYQSRAENPHGFQFFGLDLLQTPQTSDFMSMMWLIPVLCLVSSWASQFIMMKTQPTMQQQQGCMKYFFYGMSLFTAYLAFTMPGAVGFYWIIQNLLGILQSFITYKFFGQNDLVARAEAARVARRELEEAKVKELPANQQMEIRRTLEAKFAASAGKNAQRAAACHECFQCCGRSHVDGGQSQSRGGQHIARERQKRVLLHHAVGYHIAAVAYQVGAHAEHVGVKRLKGADVAHQIFQALPRDADHHAGSDLIAELAKRRQSFQSRGPCLLCAAFA